MAETLTGADSAPRAISYHCQQALEKGLKALMAANDVDPPRIHNLAVLNAELSPPIFTEAETDFLVELTVWAMVQRYPADLAEVTAAHG